VAIGLDIGQLTPTLLSSGNTDVDAKHDYRSPFRPARPLPRGRGGARVCNPGLTCGNRGLIVDVNQVHRER
jgi:hypothetical protein